MPARPALHDQNFPRGTRATVSEKVRSGIVITGPTAAGKTELSLRLAKRLSVPVVSADSLSVYRELEIGTAKPSRRDRKKIPHHLMDIRSIGDSPYAAGEFARDFFKLLPNLPPPTLIVGGTGFYIDAVVRGLAATPKPDEEIRERLLAEESAAPGRLHERLSDLDPDAARKIGPKNVQRLVRALEVCEITGGKFSSRARVRPDFSPFIFVLTVPREDLYRRIAGRTTRMFSEGLLEETELLLAKFSPTLPAFASIGYAEAVQCLSGRITRAEAVDRAARRTRNLAKRQLTWWRHFRYERVSFVPAGISPDEVLRVSEGA